MKAIFQKFVTWLDGHGSAFHYNDIEKRKTTILIRASFLAGFFMILYIGNCYLIDFKVGFNILPFESLIFFSLPFLIQLGLKPKIVAHIFILNGTAFGILLVWFSGGLQSPVSPWLTLMPICAILFMDARNAWIWAFIILGVVSSMGLYWLLEDAAPKDYDQSKDPLYFLNCYAGLIFIYLLLSLIFEKRLNATINELEVNKSSLEKVNIQLNDSLDTIKKTQTQLVQSEKLASLGELTAGIAHEIQNPLNFVNNFSEINKELVHELIDELDKGNLDLVKEIAKDIMSNEEKIVHHGTRADAIVKGMLLHSRINTGSREMTDVNGLCDEYLRLAYHGLRAKDKSFNAYIETDFYKDMPEIKLNAQDLGRVILNLITNAFHAVRERSKYADETYKPTVIVSTNYKDGKLEIIIKDNGVGIPEKLQGKIFQPFFTTKPTGEGTGLGLSLSYDILKSHGGNITFESIKDAGTTFKIIL
jgi:signal transduction histidine kinase